MPRLSVVLVVLCTAGGGVGCVRSVVAPFTARPDTVVAGNLIGPFDGRIVDADSGRPIGGADVLAAWAFEGAIGVPGGLRGPTRSAWRLVTTDADGRYSIPTLDRGPCRGELVRFTLIAYKRGHIAYRSDRYFEDLAPRRDFAQSGNVARLARAPSGLSHARHIRFIGASGPLLASLGWELQQAGLETGAPLDPVGTIAKDGGARLDASQLITVDELKAVTGYNGAFAIEKLGDLPTTDQYDSIHFRATGQPEQFDAALRVFHVTAADQADKQFAALLKELPGATERAERGAQIGAIGDRSLRARDGDVLGVAALDRTRGFVVVFTCGIKLCGEDDTAVRLLQRMWTRLDRLGRLAPSEPNDAAKQPSLQLTPVGPTP